MLSNWLPTCTNPLSRASLCSSCNRRSQSRTVSSLTSTRVGTVLMNNPIIDSTPASSAGRPEIVVPNSTVRSPEYSESSRPHAAWIMVLTVIPLRRATSDRPSTVIRVDALDRDRCASAGCRSYGSGVLATPSTTSRQYSPAAS
ncbi:hypothetical protein GCM10018954_081800 [Kutzneria kofuensis]